MIKEYFFRWRLRFRAAVNSQSSIETRCLMSERPELAEDWPGIEAALSKIENFYEVALYEFSQK